MSRHHGPDARLLCAEKWKKLHALETNLVGRQDRQGRMGIDGGAAVPGEVLRAGQDERPLFRVVGRRPLDLADELLDVPGDRRRVLAERARGDDRVGGVRVHVGHRREEETDPARGGFVADDPRDAAKQGKARLVLQRTGRCESHRPGNDSPSFDLLAEPPLQVGGDEQGEIRLRLEPRKPLSDIVEAPAEENEPARAGLDHGKHLPPGPRIAQPVPVQPGKDDPRGAHPSRHPGRAHRAASRRPGRGAEGPPANEGRIGVQGPDSR